MHNLFPITVEADAQQNEIDKAKQIAAHWDLQFVESIEQGLALVQTQQRLELRQWDDPKVGAVYVDFASDAMTFRRLHGGGKKESIAKAVGVKGQSLPSVLDATAGLGRDAFVLASLGCHVQMIERSPVVAALLADGLARAADDPDLGQWLPERMHLFHGVSYDLLETWGHTPPEVVYLDPMFPHRKKTAMVKKEMRLFQQLLGEDQDADKLLSPALNLASKRVVVKRPASAPTLQNREPNMKISSKKHRFDVYLTNL